MYIIIYVIFVFGQAKLRQPASRCVPGSCHGVGTYKEQNCQRDSEGKGIAQEIGARHAMKHCDDVDNGWIIHVRSSDKKLFYSLPLKLIT